MRHPGWAPVLEEFGIDGRAGTDLTLAGAADRAGVDVAEVVAALSGPATPRRDCATIGGASVTALVEHIQAVHHAYLRAEFPRIADLFESALARDPNDAVLASLSEQFDRLRADMEPHLDSEEAVLFPMCRDIANAFSWPSFHTGPISNPIGALRHDHAGADAHLAGLADRLETSGAIDDELDESLRVLVSDMRLHLVEENDVLFPRVIALAEELEED